MTSRTNNSPVYQIDFTAVDSGKRIASSKRRIRWRFGFTNQDSLSAGETGTACRGEEHDITLVWSISSGKRLILADGREVHYSNNRSHVFDFSWTMRGNHVLKVVAYAHPPMNVSPGFRQYDFYVDGMSFFSMPKVYRLGLSASASTNEPSGALVMATSSRHSGGAARAYNNYSMGGSGAGGTRTFATAGGSGNRSVRSSRSTNIAEIEAPHTQDEEEAYLAEAIKNSLKVDDPPPIATSEPEIAVVGSDTYGAAPVPASGDDLLIDFMSDPAPAPVAAAPAAPTQDIFAPQSTSATVQPQPQPAYSQNQYPQPTAYPSNPNATAATPFDMASSTPAPPVASVPAIPVNTVTTPLTTTTQDFPTMTAAAALPTALPTTAPPQQPILPPVVPPPVTPTIDPSQPPPPPAEESSTFTSNNAKGLSMNPPSTGLGTDANTAYAKFANMDQFDIVSSSKKDDSRANPFDDVMTGAPAPTLAGMKLMGSGASASGQSEKKEVMKAGPAEPYALVVAGEQNGNWGSNTYGNTQIGAGGGMMNQYPMNVSAPTNTPMSMNMSMNQSVASSITNSQYGQVPGTTAPTWNAPSSIPTNVNVNQQPNPTYYGASTPTAQPAPNGQPNYQQHYAYGSYQQN